ncbi:MAG: M3 family metallopeptidase, partial [Gammaproteobacteria bacterium]|nr:M3 family metallopeptidase [Gammaproteobacteria bacterium]
MKNPLLSHSRLPLFHQIEPHHALTAVQEGVRQANERISALITSLLEPSWDNLMQPLDEVSALIQEVWSPIGHLNAVKNTPEWRDAYHACLPILTQFSTQLGQNHKLYQKVLQLSQSASFSSLSMIQKKIIHDQLRDFHLSGVALKGDKKRRYADIQQRLSVLGAKFEENVLDATHHWCYVTDNPRDLAGLPEHILAFSRQKAVDKAREGCYLLTLDAPCYIAVMKYADNADLRYQMYHAYTTRASDQGPSAGQFDNTAVMLELVQLKQELAHMLNFKHYADYSLATKMAGSVNDVMEFLLTLAKQSRAYAEKELMELNTFANDHLGMEALSAWDIAYVSEKLQQHQYSVNEELLRSYFPIDRVLSGMFAIIDHIYGMRVVEKATGPDGVLFVEVWHPDVRFFEIYDAGETLRGTFLLGFICAGGKAGWRMDG